jgi:hypothetical protein
MHDSDGRRRLLESEIERRLTERFAALRDEFERLRTESDGRWSGFASRLEQKIAGIVPVDLLPSLLATNEAPETGKLSIAEALELDGAATQVEVLQRLLEIGRRRASRVVLLVLRTGSWTVWKASGYSSGAVAQEAVKQVAIPTADEGPLARVRDGTPCRLGASNEVSSRLLCSDAVDAVVVPMTIGDKVSGALYADAAAGGEKGFDPEAIAFLTYLAGLLIERLPSRKLRPSPALREIARVAAAESPAAPTARENYDTEMLSLWQEAPEGVPEGAPPSSSARVVPGVVSPPPASTGARRLTGPLAPPDEDEDERHIEARRFAELLVSEIKLYNEHAVREGRAQGNIYKRLKEEIDLSRRVYDQRIPEAVRAGSDFLREELVRILADGRAEALGM